MSNDAFKAALAELRRKYGMQLAAALTRIEALAEALARGTATPAEREQLQREVHTLAGSAPTFGYQRVGAAAFQVEQQFKALQREQRAPAPAEAHTLATLVYSVRLAAEQDAGDGDIA